MLTRVYNICQSQSDQDLHWFPLSAVWSVSTLFAILSKKYYQGLHCLPFSEVIRIYNICYFFKQYYQNLHCLPFSTIWSRSTLFAILSNLIKVYTICNSQQSDQGLHYFPFFPSSITLFAIFSLIRVYTICHYQQSVQGLYNLPFFLTSIIKVYTFCHFQQSDQGLQYLPFSVWSGSTAFAILSSLVKVNTVCYSQPDQTLHFLPFSAGWLGSTLFSILSI